MAKMEFGISDVVAGALEQIRNDGYTVQRWIPCSERMPEQSEDGQPNGVRCSDCVMITDGRLIHMAYCVNDEWQYADCGQVSDFVEYAVTHWMPLPLPPEGGNQE